MQLIAQSKLEIIPNSLPIRLHINKKGLIVPPDKENHFAGFFGFYPAHDGFNIFYTLDDHVVDSLNNISDSQTADIG